jgi:hypothetical protein
VVGTAKFGNRPPDHLAGGGSVFGKSIADFYEARRIVFWRLTPFFGYQIADPLPHDSAYCFLGGLVLETCMAICHEPALLTTVIP